MATYLEELHDLFPNGLLAVAPPLSDRNDANLLIPLFDDFEIEDAKSKNANQMSSEAHDLVDAILYEIDPSLVSRKADIHLSPSSKGSISQANGTVTERSTTTHPSSRQESKGDARVAQVARQGNLGHSRALPPTLRDSPGAGIRSERESYDAKALSRDHPEAFDVPRMNSGHFQMSKSSRSAPPSSPTSSETTSAETSPVPIRFLKIAGRAKGQTEAGLSKRSEPTASVSQPPRQQEVGGRLSIFNKTSVRPAAPPQRRGNSSESEGSPPTARNPSYSRARSAASFSERRGNGRKNDSRENGLPHVHRWDFDGSERPKDIIQGRYISSGVIVDPAADMRQADFTGYQNGWKPPTSRSGGRTSDGYVLGGRSSRRNDANYNGEEENEEEMGSTKAPFHWTGDVDIEPGKRRIIGRGALGSRPGTFKSRSDERFAAATAALEREQEAEFANRIPDPIENMHPAAASWEMQRRGILLRSDRSVRSPRGR